MQKQDTIFRSYKELEDSLSVRFDAFENVKKKLRSLSEPKVLEHKASESISLEQKDS